MQTALSSSRVFNVFLLSRQFSQLHTQSPSPQAGAAYSTGTRTVNVLPFPTSLSTPMDPPSSSANFFVIDRPGPLLVSQRDGVSIRVCVSPVARPFSVSSQIQLYLTGFAILKNLEIRQL